MSTQPGSQEVSAVSGLLAAISTTQQAIMDLTNHLDIVLPGSASEAASEMLNQMESEGEYPTSEENVQASAEAKKYREAVTKSKAGYALINTGLSLIREAIPLAMNLFAPGSGALVGAVTNASSTSSSQCQATAAIVSKLTGVASQIRGLIG